MRLRRAQATPVAFLASCLLAPSLLASCASFEAPDQPKVVIFFGHASTVIDETGAHLVQIAAARAKEHPEALVTVAGFAANHGDPDADASLAQTRAQDVATLLEQDGVSVSRISVVPRPPSNEDARVGSRRVEITVGAGN